MADIDIQKKERGGGIWPWILGLVALVALIWIGFEAFDRDEPDGITQEEVVTPGTGMEPGLSERGPAGREPFEGAPAEGDDEVSSAVREYIAFVEQSPEMGRDHEYTATGLTRLAAALGAIVDLEANSDADVETVRNTLTEQAERIQQDPQATTHARRVQEAFTSAADLMAQLQQNRFPGMEAEVSEVEQAAQALEPSGNVLDQREEVRQFFAEAGQALERMAQMSNGLAQR